MPKVKPILVFIMASIALHWWVLSLPIFQRIKHLESSSPLNTSPTIVAKLSSNQSLLEAPNRSQAETSTKQDLETNHHSQPLPPPSLLRGSPWLRRPAESRSRNFGDQPPTTVLTQIENALQEIISEPASNLQCKRSGLERPYLCIGSSGKEQSEKIMKALNQLSPASMMPMPDCIILEFIENKWHARACHS